MVIDEWQIDILVDVEPFNRQVWYTKTDIDAMTFFFNAPRPKKIRTISRERTRSPRWRAGSKSMKPKYFWPKRKRYIA